MEHEQVMKQKNNEGCKNFNETWKLNYLFTLKRGKAVCLVCTDSITVFTEKIIEEHYKTHHEAEFANLQGQERADKLKKLENNLYRDYQRPRRPRKASSKELGVKAGYAMCLVLIKKLRLFDEGETVKKCLTAVAEVAFPEQLELINGINLTKYTISQKVTHLSENMKEILTKRIKSFEWCSIAIDETTMTYNGAVIGRAYLSIFIRGIDSEFNKTEELASLITINQPLTSEYIYKNVIETLEKWSIPLEKIIGISTHGEEYMTNWETGVATTLVNYIQSKTKNEILVNHCIIHQHYVCTKILKMNHVIIPLQKLLSFSKGRILFSRNFKELSNVILAEYGHPAFNREIRWLCRSTVLKTIYDLKAQIQTYNLEKNIVFPQFEDKEWMADFAFLIDITHYLDDFNAKLQKENHYIYNMYEKVIAFEEKLLDWHKNLKRNSPMFFQYLTKERPSNCQKYALYIEKILLDFERRFAALKADATIQSYKIFSSPFDIEIENVPDDLVSEFIDLKSDSDLAAKFQNVSLCVFYKDLDPEKFPKVRAIAKKMVAHFGNICLTEQVYNILKLMKHDQRMKKSGLRSEKFVQLRVSNLPLDLDSITKKHLRDPDI